MRAEAADQRSAGASFVTSCGDENKRPGASSITIAADGSSSFKWRLDQYEEKVGRWFAGITKEGRGLIDIPLSTALDATQAQNKAYRFGRMLALDVFAASAALLIWNVVSRFSAKSRASHSAPASTPRASATTSAIAQDDERALAPMADASLPSQKLLGSSIEKQEMLAEPPLAALRE